MIFKVLVFLWITLLIVILIDIYTKSNQLSILNIKVNLINNYNKLIALIKIKI